MIEAFHIKELNLEPDASDSPLASIAYNRYAPMEDYAKDVADFMCRLPWMEVYGLSYNQVMQLPYDEWRILLEKLEQRQANPTTHMLQSSITTMTELLKALLVPAKKQRDR